MAATRPGRIMLQMAAIIGIGFAIGLVDGFIVRPVDMSARQAPEKSIDDLIPGGGESPNPGNTRLRPTEAPGTGQTKPKPVVPPPAPADPTPHDTKPAPNATPAANAGGEPTPFVPTKKEALPQGQITLEEAKRAFDAGAMFVDARNMENFTAGHVENAIRIESAMFREGDPPELGLIPRSAIVVVYCNGGHCDESENVAKFLSNSGYGKVFVMHDGFPGWKAMGYPFTTGE